jgi:large subunit ribosomal protein L5
MATSKATPKAAPTTPRLKERYRKEIVPALMKEFSYSNVMQAPVVHKIVINIGMGEALQNAKAMENAVRDLSDITGQRPVITKAKRSVASFKLREGNPIGCTVTLRGNHMYDFLDKLVSVALPRLRDFQGVSRDSFDGRGNYTLGIREQLVFPEINYDKIDKVRGMEITIVTTARTDEEGRRLLQLVGMPFKHQQSEQA